MEQIFISSLFLLREVNSNRPLSSSVGGPDALIARYTMCRAPTFMTSDVASSQFLPGRTFTSSLIGFPTGGCCRKHSAL